MTNKIREFVIQRSKLCEGYENLDSSGRLNRGCCMCQIAAAAEGKTIGKHLKYTGDNSVITSQLLGMTLDDYSELYSMVADLNDIELFGGKDCLPNRATTECQIQKIFAKYSILVTFKGRYKNND